MVCVNGEGLTVGRLLAPRVLGRLWIAALGLGLCLAPAAGAQTGAPINRGGNIFDRLNHESMRPVPTVPPSAAPRPDSTWVPDRYLSLPGAPGPVHVPGHWERQVSPYEVYTPPLVGTAPDGTQILFPAGVQPNANQRQSP